MTTAKRYHICGSCHYCRTLRETICADRLFTGDWGMVGGYAEYVAIEDDNVAQVPDGVLLDTASIVSCAIGTIYNAVVGVGHLEMGETAKSCASVKKNERAKTFCHPSYKLST